MGGIEVEEIETVIIGGGQAGLAVSYFLNQRKHENIILEQASQAANAWRNDRWDSFTLVSPNWSFQLPGGEYQGPNPDGFMGRAEVVATFEQYIERFRLPVQYNQKVLSVEPNGDRHGYLVRMEGRSLQARNVVVASGLYQRPKLPAFSTQLSSRLIQVHSGQYRNPRGLPPGAALVVGSAQSGCQIAEELYQSGRKVYLCTGSAGRAPRRYRGKDVFTWLMLCGFFDRTVDQLPSPKVKFAGNPQVSGKNGGHTLNLHQFARDGVTLLGQLQDGRDDTIWLAPDLKENLAKVDRFEAELVKLIEGYIARSGMDAPQESLPALRDGYAVDELTSLDLQAAGVTTIIWAMGYAFDFNMVKLPVFDGDGYPIQRRGITAYPGLFFVGLPWLYKYKSALLAGVAEDAEFVAKNIQGN
jgi:putative flavoprotein involved in K+ transport